MIDLYFKQFFWTFHLLALGAFGVLSARTVNAFAGSALMTPVGQLLNASSTANAVQASKASEVDPKQFLEVNLFSAEREDLTPVPPSEADAAAAAGSGGPVDTSRCEAASMRVSLVATIVSTDPEASVAVFTDAANSETSLAHRVGERINDEATILDIAWREVKVDRGGRCELFTIKDDPPSAPSVVAQAEPPASNTNANNDLGAGVKKIGDGNYEIPRGELDNVLGNLNLVATQGRIVPSFQNGKANGFKLFSIRPGSLYDRIGIQNGDVVQKINGYEMSSPDKALEIYTKLKDAASITVDVVRRGKNVTNTYNIR